jgi:hypothetical protein
MDLIDHLQSLAARADQTGDSLTNEEATKMAPIAMTTRHISSETVMRQPVVGTGVAVAPAQSV